MAYTAVSFAYKEVLTSAKMTLLAENDAYLKGVTDALGVWTAYAPAIAGVTLGTGSTTTARFNKVNKTLEVRVAVVLGTGGAVTGDIFIPLPAGNTAAAGLQVGAAVMTDVSVGTDYLGVPRLSAGTAGFYIAVHASFVAGVGRPFAWTNGDSFSAGIRCEVV